jgi:DUF1365 family protein
VIITIHFEALRLWWKGAPFFRRTPQQGQTVTGTDLDISPVDRAERSISNKAA